MKTTLSVFTVLMLASSGCNLFSKASAPIPSPAPVKSSVKTSGKILETSKPAETVFQLYRLLAANPTNVNLSPLSMKIAFSLIYPGTSGDTKKLYEQIFGFNESDTNPFHAEYELAAKTESLKSDTNQLLIENSVWMKSKKTTKSDFIKSLKTQNAEIGKLNLDAINAWVASATHNKIPALLSGLDPSAKTVFINAIYFKQNWLTPFDAKITSTDQFQNSQYASSRIPTLHAEKEVQYYEDKTSKWVGLAYADSPFEMLLGLPNKRFDLRSIEDNLSSTQIATLLGQMKPVQVALSIPKFKLNEMVSFKSLFENAGYGELFSDADYSEMTSQSSALSDVIQATSIELSETGTEASAASGGMVLVRKSRVKEPMFEKSFIADQPFIFVLLNKDTKEIYELGRVSQPLLTK